MKMIKLCKQYVCKYKYTYCIYVLLSLIVSAISVFIPYITGSFINNINLIINNQTILRYCGIILCLNLIKILFNYLAGLMNIKVQAKAGFDLNKAVLDHIKKLPSSFFSTINPSYLNQRINNDSNEIIIFFTQAITNSIVNIGIIGACLLILNSINKNICIIVLMLIISYLSIFCWFKLKLYKANYSIKEYKGLFFSSLQEQISEIKFQKLHSVNKYFDKRLINAFEMLYNKVYFQKKIVSKFDSYEQGISAISLVVLFVFSSNEVIKGNLEIGFFIIINTYFNMLISSMKYFIEFFKEYQNQKVSYARIIELLQMKQQHNGSLTIEDIKTIKMNNVSFSYNSNNVFDEFTVEFHRGNIYAIIGKNGAGKSTLINMILGMFIEQYKGEIFINQINISNINMEKIRGKKIGITEQEPTLLNDTLLNNIMLESYEYDTILLEKYIEKLYLKDYVLSLSSGLDTTINIENSNLSGGEKQKIAIVRQLIKNPDVMIFDEPTSAMDEKSQKSFFDIIEEIKHDKIIIIVSHDIECINKCDVRVEVK